jgi:hypothetical protein
VWFTATAVLFALILPGASPAYANGSAPSRGATEFILNVPFVPQDKQLCGGACLAMVMRYHGTPSLRAGDFADYLGTSGGITTTSMVRAADARGYDAQVFSGDVATLCEGDVARRARDRSDRCVRSAAALRRGCRRQ